MEQNPAVQRLRALELKRIEVLKSTIGQAPDVIDSVEDPILEEMDVAWGALTQEERDHCREPSPNHEETLKWLVTKIK